MSLSRRELLRRATWLPLVVLAFPNLEGCADSKPDCVDIELLSTSEVHLRKTLEYVDRGPDSNQQCGGCQFFTAADPSDGGGCGHCKIVDGAVSRLGSCKSWSKRA
jgi:hypothetical protein